MPIRCSKNLPQEKSQQYLRLKSKKRKKRTITFLRKCNYATHKTANYVELEKL